MTTLTNIQKVKILSLLVKECKAKSNELKSVNYNKVISTLTELGFEVNEKEFYSTVGIGKSSAGNAFKTINQSGKSFNITINDVNFSGNTCNKNFSFSLSVFVAGILAIDAITKLNKN